MRAWVRALIEFVATKKGMATALALAAHNKTLSAYSFERLAEAVGLLLDRLGSAGRMHRQIAPQDFLRALIGIILALEGADWRDKATPLMDVFIDGLIGTVAPPG